MSRLSLITLVFVLACASFAQITDIQRTPIRGAMQPAISPDASKIAFRYRGDIWIVPAEGGLATRITDHIELNQKPIWSPDGKWLAFSSDRNGNYDIFAIPVGGGETRQITYSGNDEVATDWSPDGRWILFTGRRDSPWTGIFAIDVRTLDFRLIAQDYQGLSNPMFSPNGRQIAAQRNGFAWTRPRYHGSGGAQIVTFDFETGRMRTVLSNGHQNLWPFFSADGTGVYAVTYGEVTPSAANFGESAGKFVDNANRTPNLWRFDLDGKGQRVTNYVGQQVRTPSMSRTGTIVFEREGHIYTFSNGRERRVDIIAYVDSKFTDIERQVLTDGATEAIISPDEKTFAFVAGSELWTVPIEKPSGRNKDDATRLTDHAGVDEEIEWSADGKTIYFVSDRNSSRRLFALDVETKGVTPVWRRDDDVLGPKLSPDGKSLAFWAAGSEGGLYVWNIDGAAQPRKVLHQPGTHFFGQSAGEFAWSPDSRWFAVTRRQIGGTWNVWILPAAGGAAINITQRNVGHSNLAWSPDGKYLYFSSTREGGGYFITPLQKETEDPEEIELKYEKPKEDEELRVEIEFDGINRRVRRLFSQGVGGNVRTDPANGNIYFLAGGNLWMSSYDGKNARQIVAGPFTQFSLSEDSKSAFALRSGVPVKITLSGNYPVTTVAFRAELVQDANLVRKSAFTEFWRMYNRAFYDGNFHGRDWAKIRARYEPLLEGVGHRREFAELLNMMVGELEGSHTEVGPAPGGTRGGPSVSHPGFLFDYTHRGPGIKVLGTYERAPATFDATRINPGEYVMQINGTDASLNERIFEALHNQSGRDLVLLVNDKPSKEGAREVKYRAISSGAFSNLRYDQWVEENRRRVERETGGKIGYIHIRGMGGGDRTRFEEEFHEQKLGKDAMIIDVRFNGGGNISDSLIDLLERQPHGYYQPRDGWMQMAPNDQIWAKPTVVLHNEGSFSNAEMFPYAMKERGLALLIGMPTPGYVIWTWGGRLVDGTSIRMPSSGVYRMDGTPMENMGQQPDIMIPWSNEDFMAGKDPQLDRAIQEAMRKTR